MSRYHVFLGAPPSDLPLENAAYSWKTTVVDDGRLSALLPLPMTAMAYESASQMLSNVYKGAIFGRDADENFAALEVSERWEDNGEPETKGFSASFQLKYSTNHVLSGKTSQMAL